MEYLYFLLLCTFLSTVTAQENDVCVMPELGDHVEAVEQQMYFSPGTVLPLACELGYTSMLGPRTIVCTEHGEWTKTQFMCIAKRCPYPDAPLHGKTYYEDTVYKSTVNYTCHEGYTLSGPNSAKCQANRTWSTSKPECKPVSCGLAPIPKFGLIIYNKNIKGNTTYFGIHGTYKCLPPYALFGNAHAECTANGNWTKTPECKVVTCPPPENIANGYMSTTNRKYYYYLEIVRYGCNGDYELEGSFQTVCQKDGEWSEKPVCKAPCSIDIKRGRILYKEQKLWIEAFQPNRVLHGDIVSVYCMDKARKCGYAVSSQCTDGKLKIPECYEEPSSTDYALYSGSLPSEIEQCYDDSRVLL
ncbi:beta-2-glycoprotein 1-like [Dunckerocampus dactyliophorus]|uniref:beta-2-glycoprotein 1-like n=1 Tax=Dunckerocampus dactyliophorus TaxID=161453 RepID=UPI002406BE23|nr:beta-2-glycoprotein 1-like [Dunckerocampus dactyliophorus]